MGGENVHVGVGEVRSESEIKLELPRFIHDIHVL